MSLNGSRTQSPAGSTRSAPRDSEFVSQGTWRSVARQCLNARVPGYMGFIPSYEAEAVFGRTQAGAGRSALKAQKINMDRKADEEKAQREFENFQGSGGAQHRSGQASPSASGQDWHKGDPGSNMRSQHPDGSSAAHTMLPPSDSQSFIPRRAEAPCQVKIQRNHWVPPVPGYSGFVPARYSENICGGGLTHTAKMCARAINERRPPETEHLKKTVQDDVLRERLVAHFHETNKNDMAENSRLVDNYKKHCSTKIPGYTGHIPRKDGESVFGATACRANLVCQEIAVDKLENPSDHFTKTVAPQFPAPRQCYP